MMGKGHVWSELGTRQSAWLRHPDGIGVPFLHGLHGVAAAISAALRRSALRVGGTSDHRQRSLVGLRPVRRIPVSSPVAAYFFFFGLVLLPDLVRQGAADFLRRRVL